MRTSAALDVIGQVLAGHPVISRRDHPELAGSLDWALRRRLLVAVLPGVYAPPATAGDLTTRLAAVQPWRPDAVVTGRAAARLTFWPQVRVSEVEVAATTTLRRPGFTFRRRSVPAELAVQRSAVRLSAPALTALDLAPATDGASIDAALRSRQVRLGDLERALSMTPHRSGNAERRRLLLDSRAEPWSYAERRAHRVLRAAGISGWQANVPVAVVGGHLYFLDIAFEELRLALEIDGRTHHGPEAFESDRWRQNDIVLEGWCLQRFPAETVLHHEALFLHQVDRAIEHCRSSPALRGWSA